ncbi:type II secretion system protein N [Candidatus Enterovibrio escicola]|uniref:type II secretion system protein N n=1 Tax=Candidatus Enterovibrio escicola TaxID=1927127 RepID=UPI001CC25ACD|nr:type II secretion system protein N [Candidatus Enterovibrio escacola]
MTFVSVVTHIPASFALRYLPATPKLYFQEVLGTVWKGSAQALRWQGTPLGILNWQFNLWSLFTGNVEVETHLSGILGLSAHGNLGYGVKGIYANNFLLSAPATFVQSFIPYPVPVSLSGQFDLTVQEYQLNEPFCDTLKGYLTWSRGNVVSQLGMVNPGHVIVTLSCDTGSLVLNGRSESDALRSEFNVSLDPNQRYEVNGWFINGEALPEGIKDQLGWLGKPDNEGRYRLSFSG